MADFWHWHVFVRLYVWVCVIIHCFYILWSSYPCGIEGRRRNSKDRRGKMSGSWWISWHMWLNKSAVLVYLDIFGCERRGTSPFSRHRAPLTKADPLDLILGLFQWKKRSFPNPLTHSNLYLSRDTPKYAELKHFKRTTLGVNDCTLSWSVFFFVIIILNCPGTERALLRTNPRSLKRKTVRVTLIGSCGSGRCWLSNNGFVDETIQVFVISELDRTNQLVE